MPRPVIILEELMDLFNVLVKSTAQNKGSCSCEKSGGSGSGRTGKLVGAGFQGISRAG